MQFPLRVTDFDAISVEDHGFQCSSPAARPYEGWCWCKRNPPAARPYECSQILDFGFRSHSRVSGCIHNTPRRAGLEGRGGGIVGGACFVAVSYVPFGPALAAFLRMLCRLSPCIRKARAAGGTQMRAVGRSICEAVCER